MVTKRIVIEFNSEWLLEQHKLDAEPPAEICEKAMKEAYGEGCTVIAGTPMELMLKLSLEKEKEPMLKASLTALFSKAFGEPRLGDIMDIAVADYIDNDALSDFMEVIDQMAAARDMPEKGTEVLCEIDALEGCEEFKKLAHELADVAPQIIKYNTAQTFLFQNFLFSVNKGCGLTTYLTLLARLIAETGLAPNMYFKDIQEIEVPVKSQGNSEPPLQRTLSMLISGRKKDMRLVCLDISEWISRLKEPAFKKFLTDLGDMEDKYVFVFRIPFLEASVLKEISAELSDVLFIREVVIVPLDNDETLKIAEKTFDKMGYRMEADAWDIFSARLAEEKSDGRFYGINTINKVVNETVYRKQLFNSKTGADDTLIRRESILSLAALPNDIQRTGMQELEDLKGMEEVKKTVCDIVSRIEFAQNLPYRERPCIHMRFVGNPGTGKTTVARILGKILKERSVLRNGSFFEYSGRDFCGQYIGETAPKTAAICRDAYGSVLFIDEAYSLYTGDDNSRDYGREALTTLIAEMENHRTDLVVIMAGYRDEMTTLMRGNPGIAGRMPYIIDFPNFSRSELFEIFMFFANRSFSMDEGFEAAAEHYFNGLPEEFIGSKEFSNARFARNLYERTWGIASNRTRLEKGSSVILKADDLILASADKDFAALSHKRKPIGFI